MLAGWGNAYCITATRHILKNLVNAEYPADLFFFFLHLFIIYVLPLELDA